MLSISIRIDYIHAERLSEAPAQQLQVQVQITAPSAEPTWRETSAQIPFTFSLTTTPPMYSISIRGRIVVSGTEKEVSSLKDSLQKGQTPSNLLQALTQTLVFEAALLSRELGFPPLLPIGQPQQKPPPPEVLPV